MKTIYLFSGLGADHRAFEQLDFGGYTVSHISWIRPLKNEKIQEYAKRLAVQITVDNPIFIGLSFGGIMAIEVAKVIKTTKIVLIASAKLRIEIPFYFRWAGKIGLHRLLPSSLLINPSRLNYWLFSAKTKPDKRLLNRILQDTDIIFLRWALQAIVQWKNELVPTNLVHIHGSSDKILPIRYVKANFVVPNGGHLMTIDKAAEISRLLREVLKGIN